MGNSNDFRAWLTAELKKRGWSQKDLYQRAGVSQASVSLLLKGQRNPGADFCVKAAKALGVSPIDTLKLAGILPETTKGVPVEFEDAVIADVVGIMHTLTPQQRADVLRYVQFIASQRQ